MYDRFGLTLMVNHACNLRCAYCYTGTKASRPMPEPVGRAAIDRAVASLRPGGTLELGFFGGEPLLEAERVAGFLAHARAGASQRGAEVAAHLTTNGTIDSPAAWAVLTDPGVRVSVSCDGAPATHDRHRRDARGRGSSAGVIRTIRRLVDFGVEVEAIAVVRPDTADALADGVAFLRDLGVRQVVLSLDLWARWSGADAAPLEAALGACADLWRNGFPEFGISPFTDKLGALAGLPASPTARCGFGAGSLAVAPSGRLYPCERLIGDDPPDHPLRLPGHAREGEDFLDLRAPAPAGADGCSGCGMAEACDTDCRCSNWIRTGDPDRPDRLLCWFNQVCAREAARVFAGPAAATAFVC